MQSVLRVKNTKVPLPKKIRNQLEHSSLLSLSGFHLCELLDKKYIKRNAKKSRCFY